VDIIVYLRNTSSQGIKKEGEFGVFLVKNGSYEEGHTIGYHLPYKINNK
jgi:hypothetical protein